jgi:hypothetical protein
MATKKQSRTIHKIVEEIVNSNSDIVAILDEEGARGWEVLSLEKREVSLTKMLVTIIFKKTEA